MPATPAYAYRIGQELPSMAFEWLDRDGAVIDFSSGWTFAAKLALATDPGTIVATISSGITGAATSPNVVIDWSTTAFDALTPAAGGTVYVVHLIASRTSDSKDREFSPGNPPRMLLFPAFV